MINKEYKNLWDRIKKKGHMAKAVALTMCFVLFTTSVDVTAFAFTGDVDSDKNIVGITSLSDEIANQKVKPDATLEDVEFPESLDVHVTYQVEKEIEVEVEEEKATPTPTQEPQGDEVTPSEEMNEEDNRNSDVPEQNPPAEEQPEENNQPENTQGDDTESQPDGEQVAKITGVEYDSIETVYVSMGYFAAEPSAEEIVVETLQKDDADDEPSDGESDSQTVTKKEIVIEEVEEDVSVSVEWTLDEERSSKAEFENLKAGEKYIFVPTITEDGYKLADDVKLPAITVEVEENISAFEQSVTVDGVVITVTADEGVFPEGASVSARKVSRSEANEVEDAIDEVRDNDKNVALSYTFDITIKDKDGNKIEPDTEKGSVKVTFKMAEIANSNLETEVYHVEETDGGLNAESLGTSEESSDEVTVETDGFSYYTVEFTYGELQYVLPGDSRVELTTILDTIGIEVNGEIMEVSGSNNSLFKPVNEDGTWYIEAVTAFTSTEWLKVKIGETSYEIVVTDAGFETEEYTGDGTITSPFTSKTFAKANTAKGWTSKFINNLTIEGETANFVVFSFADGSESKEMGDNTLSGLYYLKNYTRSYPYHTFSVLKVDKYTISYNYNSGSGSKPDDFIYWYYKDGTTSHMVKSDNSNSTTFSYTIPTTTPTRTGFTFTGWNTNTYGTGKHYNKGETITSFITSNTTLYAEWYADYTINYDANTSDTVAGMPSSTTVKYDTAASLSSATPAREGYTFLGWSAATDATEPTWTAGASVHTANTLKVLDVDNAISKTAGGSKTLYAVWKKNAFTVTFDSKGGSDVDAQSVTPGETATEPTAPTKNDNKFLGWTTDSEPTTSSTKFNFSTEITEDMTLYAIWKSHDHVWAYAADGNKLYAYCSVDGYNCSYYGTESELSKAIKIEVNAPSARSGALAYDGNDYVATITDTDSKWHQTFTGLPSIEYGYKEFGMGAASYSSVTDTKDAGYYKASITACEKTAYVEYQIAKQPVTLSVTMDDYEVNYQPSDPSASGGPEGAIYNFTFKKKGADDSTYSEDVPKTPWGDYTVKATYAGDKNHDSATATCDFQIKPKERTETINVVMSDYVYGQATAPVPSTDPAEIDENPSIIFKYHVIDSSAEWLVWTGDTSALDVLSGTDQYEMKAVIGATASYAEKDTPAKRFVVKKGEWKVTAPTAKTGLTYDCADQDLVNAGSVEDGGEMLYSLDGAAYNTSISKATNVGTYDVYYKIEADTNHNEYVCNSPVSVTIAKADWNVTAPTAIAPPYTGSAQELVNAGEVKDANGSSVTGKMLYSLTGNGDYSTTIPTATTVGSYTVYYKVDGDNNHNAYDAESIAATIEKADRTDTLTVLMQDYIYGQAETLPQPSIDPVAGELAEEPSVTYYYACEDDFAKALEWKDITSKSLNAGTYYMFAQVGETKTYRKTVTASKKFDVTKATYTGSEEYSKAYIYNAESSNEAIELTGLVPADAGDSSKMSFEISAQTVTPDGTASTISDATIVGNDFTYGVIGMDAYVENTSTSFDITVKTQNYNDYIQVIKITRSNCEHDYVDGVCSRCDSVSVELSKDIVIKATDYRYDEASHNPEIAVTYKGEELVNGINYTYAGNSGTEIGVYDVTVTGKGKYLGSKIVSWNITPTAGIWCADIPNQVYTGKAIKPEINVYSDGTLLTLGKDYTIAYSNNTKAALNTATNAKGKSIAPTVTITGKGNYKNSKIVRTFTIERYSLDGANSGISAEVNPTTVAYTKKAIKLSPVVTLNGKKLKMGTDYVVSTTEDESGEVKTLTEAGEYQLHIVGKKTGNYSGSIPYTFTITDLVPASKVSIGKIANQPYNNGEEVKPPVIIKNGRTDVTDKFDIDYDNNKEVGTATVTITAKDGSGFWGSKSATFKIVGTSIAKVALDADGKGKIEAYTYSGNPCKPEPDLYIGTKELENGVDYLLSYKSNVNVGTATVTVTGKGAYTGTKKFTFKINKYDAGTDTDELIKVNSGAPISVNYEKGGVTPKPRVTMLVNGIEQELKEKTDYTLGYSNNKEVADENAQNAKGKSIAPTITITFKGNLSGKQPVRFEITKKDMSSSDSSCKLTASDVATKAKAFSWKQTKITITDSNGKKLAAKTDYDPKVRYFSNESCDDASELTEATLPTNKYPNGKGRVYIKATAAETSKYYEGSVIGWYYVSGINISSAKAVITDRVYTGSEICPTEDEIAVTIKVGKETRTLTSGDPGNPNDGDFTVVPGSYTKNVNKGTASLTIRGNGEYFGTKVVKFKIINKPFEWWQ